MNAFGEYFVVSLVVASAAAVGLVPAPVHAEEATAPVFKAGAATCNITPPLGSSIVGNWESPEATYIHDDLHARCLVLDNGERRLAIAICDNLHIDQATYDEARKQLADKTGMPPEHILMASTHTHSGPPSIQGRVVPGDELSEYQRFLVNRIVDGVMCAINNLEPAQIGWGSAEEPTQVFCRRWHLSDPTLMTNPFGGQDKVRMNPPRGHEALVKPAGPTDPEIVFLSIRSADGRPIALLANYSLHYVGGVPKGHISADYFAVFADRIQQLLGADRQDPPFVGILSNGTSGNINNINFRDPQPAREPYEQMRFVANLVADKVFQACQSIEYHDQARLDGRLSELSLDARKPDEATLEWARAIQAKPEDQTELKERIYARRAIGLQDVPDKVDVWLQTLRIGDVGIAAIPFETFSETGLYLKEKGPLPVTFTISHANGAYGYLPTPAQHELGGYETWLGTNRVAVDSEPAIVARILEQFAELVKE
ncbi:MAG TPA: neutral/alkaline non-lysosomal ceramidase N-terminal domain-containing protein [Candidatus Hydrogenedentes bacterium]|nr:neutral/alkaline non-lysosomal ceramidase N-terminal domain-containing protein [Candidatus Hydrogenedentota bacterium]HPG68642.1 neutral/alkaline non-lysosomal ceramidase N-terminal domain-containing protein [Candidatus Hydrogenedentota bacterium]